MKREWIEKNNTMVRAHWNDVLNNDACTTNWGDRNERWLRNDDSGAFPIHSISTYQSFSLRQWVCRQCCFPKKVIIWESALNEQSEEHVLGEIVAQTRNSVGSKKCGFAQFFSSCWAEVRIAFPCDSNTNSLVWRPVELIRIIGKSPTHVDIYGTDWSLW